ncbi:metallophosphoesterase family protein [Thermodesulfobacteriota bacterium]
MPNQTLIHLSDLHVGLRPVEARRFKEIIDWLADRYPGAPVLITGDLTDNATKTQMRSVRRLLKSLAATNPILTVPGNHDYAWKGNILRDRGWKDWVDHLGSPLGWGKDEVYWMGVDHEPKGVDGLGVWKDGPIVYFGIDSGDPKDRQISARGWISKGLADGLAESLKKYDGKTRIALLHHHPFSEGFFTKLKGANLLMDALRDNCELLLFGHHHEYGLWWHYPGIGMICSSHKSTDNISGDCLFVTIIDIQKAGTKEVSFRHRLEVL